MEDANSEHIQLVTSFEHAKQEILTEWGPGPEPLWKELHFAWYQPYRHDIIGNTLSADLLDYCVRDPRRLSFSSAADFNLLNYYTLTLWNNPSPKREKTIDEAQDGGSKPHEPWYRCVIDLYLTNTD